MCTVMHSQALRGTGARIFAIKTVIYATKAALILDRPLVQVPIATNHSTVKQVLAPHLYHAQKDRVGG